MSQQEKQMLAGFVADEIASGNKVGLGAGSTVRALVEEIGARTRSGALEDVTLVCGAFSTELACHESGLQACSVGNVEHVDICFDGADEYALSEGALKGGGGSLFREKQLQRLTTRSGSPYIIVGGAAKVSQALGSLAPLTVELHKDSLYELMQELDSRGYSKCSIREGSGVYGPVFTEQGNLLVDVSLVADSGSVKPWRAELIENPLPGAIEHGFFPKADKVASVLDGAPGWLQ